MNKVEIDLITRIRFLSKLEHFGNDLLFIETVADMENNDYKQKLHLLSADGSSDRTVLDFRKRISIDVLEDVIFLREGEADGLKTRVSVLDTEGNVTEKAVLPLSVGRISDFTDRFYIAEATINMKCPDYHLIGEE